ncbi:MAG: L,D-transpeptidase, partial [Nannocystaceae bacterium]
IYARKYQLQRAEGSSFRGQVVTKEAPLPKHFIRRSLGFERRESEGSDILVATGVTPERRSVVAFQRKVRVGNYDYFETSDGLMIRAYAVSEVRKVDRPAGVGAKERWVHVDLGEQTLTAYEGDEPMLATLVSTGREPGMTPTGVFRIQSKFITTAMRDQPPEEDAYSIEDVPWTQYFDQNIALHGAFWHSGFGLVRSHGCVNLSPPDARWLFGFLASAVPAGWHAVMPGVGETPQGSVVYITE